MKVAFGRLVPTLAVLLLAGCRLAAPASMPLSFSEQMRASNLTFEAATRPTVGMGEAEVVAGLRLADAELPMLLSSGATPVYGVLKCLDPSAACEPGPAGFLGGRARDVWVVVYPDWVGADGDVGWVIVDAATGLQFGFGVNDPRD